jgi:hypothetical protein
MMLRLTKASAFVVGSAVVSQVGYRQAAVHCDANPEQDRADSFTSGSMIAAASAGASIAAAAAPALCAVHCAAMPFIAIALPSLQLGAGVCMHNVSRRLAIYVVVPLGLISNAVGYPQHQSIAVTASSLTGVSCVTAAATLKSVAPHRNVLNVVGCILMLGASYRGRQIEQENGGCAHCHDGADEVVHPK